MGRTDSTKGVFSSFPYAVLCNFRFSFKNYANFPANLFIKAKKLRVGDWPKVTSIFCWLEQWRKTWNFNLKKKHFIIIFVLTWLIGLVQLMCCEKNINQTLENSWKFYLQNFCDGLQGFSISGWKKLICE